MNIQVSEIENKNQEYNYSNDKNVNFIIQLIVDGYLKTNNQKSMKELLKMDNIEEEKGVIYNYHIIFLQTMFIEELKILNIDLQEEVKKNGEEFEFGKLSKFETSYLENKLKNVSGLIEIITERIIKK